MQIPGAATASASRRPVLASEDVSRSDLPPAPTAQFKSPTSPYAYNQAHSDAGETSNGVVESVDTLKGAKCPAQPKEHGGFPPDSYRYFCPCYPG